MNRLFLAVLIVIFGLGVTFFVRLSSNPNVVPSETIPSEVNPSVSNSNTQKSNPSPSGITLQVLETHNSAKDCWVAYGGKVYDVTSFLPKHPGSAGAIIPYCGTYEEFVKAFEGQHGKSKVSNLMKVGALMGDFQIQGKI